MMRLCCNSFSLILLTIFLSAVLPACTSNGKKWNPEDYTVKSGDTLYSIAWRYELDPEEFAAWNGIKTSTFIKAGQRLHTRQPGNFSSGSGYSSSNDSARNVAYGTSSGKKPNIAPGQKWIRAEKGDTLYGISQRSSVSVDELARLNQLRKPYTIQPGQTIFLKPLSTKEQTTAKNSTNSSSKSIRPTSSSGSKQDTVKWPSRVRWNRPAKGNIVKKYNRKRNDAKGIDIAGSIGQPVLAAADGKVVYSGNGLISYGNLVIIKHNKTYLSAYAYNHKLLVKEGEQVNAGQKIATMGYKEKNKPLLHFEIRKNGKPVDPLKYIPW